MQYLWVRARRCKESAQDRKRVVWTGGILTVLLSLPGCDSPTASGNELLQTGQASYRIVADEGSVGVAIDYTFSNQTADTVYLPNCGGAYFYRLERLEEGTWISAWNPPQDLCRSEPIVIEPTQAFSDTVRIWGSHGDPYFERVRTGGTFRIVWSGALGSNEGEPFSETLLPLEHRVSNSFELLDP